MSVKNKITYKIPSNNQPTITTSPGVDIRDMMLEDSTDLLDSVEVTNLADECQKLKDTEDMIKSAEQHLKDLKAKADDIGSRVIPELLAEQGLTSIKLADGSSVSVEKEYRCTLPRDDSKREQCYKWLRDNQLGDIIKNNVSVTFGRGEDDKAKQLLDLAVANGFDPQQKSDVSWNTLTALFRERIESGLDMPSEVFSTWIKDKTKITRK